MEARQPFESDEDTDQTAAIVARIQARGASHLPTPNPDAVARFLAHTAQESRMGDSDLEEHERMWRAVDDEVRALDPSSGTVPGLHERS
jgi:hypothetical protein